MEAWQLAGIASRIVLYGSLALAVGSALFGILIGGHGKALLPSVRQTFQVAAGVVVVSVLGSLLVQVGGLVDDGLSGALDLEVAGFIWAGPMGTATKTLIAGLVLIGIGFLLSGIPSLICHVVGALASSAFVALSGHGSTADSWVLPVLITVHFACLAFWIAALSPLRRAATGALPLPQAAALAHRFGQVATPIVLSLLLAGGWVAWVLLGSVQAIVSSSYGLTLLLKVGIVVGLLGLAALNRFRLVPAMLRGEPGSAAALVRSINAETALVLLILVVTASLTALHAPPAFEMAH